LSHNLRLLHALVGDRPLWPCIKANAYGHGLVLVARHLAAVGHDTLCVAHASEAVALRAAGIGTRLVLLSASPSDASDAILEHDLEPVVCGREALDSLSRSARGAGREVAVHLKVDTGMGRIGVQPDAVADLLGHAQGLDGVRVRGLMSHFPRADEADKSFSHRQVEAFGRVCSTTRDAGIEVRHMANSAAIFDLPDSHLDAARPGIAMYGLAPSRNIANPRVAELEPVLEWRSRITFLKEVPAGTGLSYGHTFHTERPSLVATFPVGYGDGLHRSLSNRMEVLVGGVRCRQVGTITMDQTLADVTALRGRVELGDPVVLIGRQGDETVTADALAETLGTINYEIVTAISARVPRVASDPGSSDAE
ncbi:MAG: alanine racemase, partial [Myxococcota bacterium]